MASGSAGPPSAVSSQGSPVTCQVCLQPLPGKGAAESGEEASQSLLCGHTFHSYCINETLKVRQVVLADLKCPVCKNTAKDLEPSVASLQPPGEESTAVKENHSVGDDAPAARKRRHEGNGDGSSPPRARPFRWPNSQGTVSSLPALAPVSLADRSAVEQPGVSASQRSEGMASPPPKPSQAESPSGRSPGSVSGTSPGVTNEAFGFRFHDGVKMGKKRAEKYVDATKRHLDRLAECRDVHGVQQAMHQKALFDGLRSEKEVYKTVFDRLATICQDPRSHRDLVAEASFTVRSLFPTPIAEAILAISLAEGWHPECLAQEVVANAAFCENPATRLKVHREETHGRCPPVPCLRAASQSARKSSLKAYGTGSRAAVRIRQTSSRNESSWPQMERFAVCAMQL